MSHQTPNMAPVPNTTVPYVLAHLLHHLAVLDPTHAAHRTANQARAAFLSGAFASTPKMGDHVFPPEPGGACGAAEMPLKWFSSS